MPQRFHTTAYSQPEPSQPVLAEEVTPGSPDFHVEQVEEEGEQEPDDEVCRYCSLRVVLTDGDVVLFFVDGLDWG
jgi:hypothetical protein